LNKNIFGVLLKKTENSFVQKEIEMRKAAKKIEEDIYKDKLNELKSLRENIVSLSPKTVSSRCKRSYIDKKLFVNFIN